MQKHAIYHVSLKVLLRRGKKVLMLRDRKNIVDLPGGRVQKGETREPFSAIIAREIKEELGEKILYRLGSPILHFTRNLIDQKEPVFILVFAADYLSGPICLSSEHTRYEWVTPSQSKFAKNSFFSEEEYNLFTSYFLEQTAANNMQYAPHDLRFLWQDNAADDFAAHLDKEGLFVYSPFVLPYLRDSLRPSTLFLDSEEIGIEKERLDAYVESCITPFQKIVGCGSGRTLDIAKYLAARSGAELILIPSILSTNTFATNKVVLKEGNSYHTYQGKQADSVVIDRKLLLASEFKWNLYGLADVLSLHTALYDWELAVAAKKSRLSFEVYHVGKLLLEKLLSNIKTITRATSDNLDLIVQLVALAGYVVNVYGNGRPESGSEHVFARSLETRVRVPHGIAVGLGIILMSELQNNQSPKITEAIRRLGLLERMRDYGISVEILSDALIHLKPRPDRYTVINQSKISAFQTKQILKTVQKKYKFQFSS